MNQLEQKKKKLLELIEEARTISAKEIGMVRGTVDTILSPQQYRCVKAFVEHGNYLSNSEVAEKVGLSRSTYCTHKKRAIEKLALWQEEKARRERQSYSD